MSTQALDWAWTQSQAKGTARLVLLALADRADGPYCQAAAGSTWLMERTGASRSTVLDALRRLKDLGEVLEIDGVLTHLAHPVYLLPKAIGHTAPAPGQPVLLVPSERIADPGSEVPDAEVARVVRERIERSVRMAQENQGQ